MSKRPFASRIVPRGELVLVRKAPAANQPKTILLPDGTAKKLRQDVSTGVVVSFGKGRYEHGTWIKMPDDIKEGATILFQQAFQDESIAEMVEENLWFVLESMIFAVILPEGLPHKTAISA